MSDSELLEFLGIEERPLLSLFIEEVANKGLQQYQKVVQYGVHKGQSLYNHVVSGVFLIHSLQEILNLSPTELKVLTIAFCIHDINKTYQGTEISYGKIAVPKNLVQEIEKIGFDAFLEDWRDYIEDITELIRGHSGHNSVRGDSLDRRSDPTKLGKRRLTELDEIIRAADVADLSQSYSERKHKRDFLSHLNRFTVQQYQLISHQVSEQRGIFTNIIHNQVANYLSEKLNALPVFLYPQGTYYLVKVDANLGFTNFDRLTIGHNIEKRIEEMKSEEYGKFIQAGTQGIKISEEILELNLPSSDIFGYANTLIQRKNYNINELEQKCRNNLQESLKKADEANKTIITEWLNKSAIFHQSQDVIKLGELIRTFYIFLSKHRKKDLARKNKKYNDTWKYIYDLLEISASNKYDIFNPNYHRSYVIAQDLDVNHDDLLAIIIKEVDLLNDDNLDLVSTMPNKQNNAVSAYVEQNLSFDFVTFSMQDFTCNLKSYVINNHSQSCYASSNLTSSKWRTSNVPKGIKVQQFSNRLLGGNQSEPTRCIDPVVQQQFSIEKLNYSSGSDKSKFMYLHIMPYSFMTAPFIESYKILFQKLKSFDTTGISLSIKEAIQFYKNQKYCVLPINKKQKNSGILLPLYSDLIGNTISLPLNILGDNQTQKYLNSIEYALLIYKHFGVKILLSEVAFPILNLTETDGTDIFLDGLPSLLRGLIPSENLYFRRDAKKEPLGSGDIVWQRLCAIREMYDLLHIIPKKQKISKDGKKKNNDLVELFALATAFTKSESYIFHELDRLIEKKAEDINKNAKDLVAIDLTRKLKELVNQIVLTWSNV